MGATHRYEVEKMLKEAKEESKARKNKIMETVGTYAFNKDLVVKHIKQDIFEKLRKKIEDYDLINEMSVSYIWKGLKVTKNTITGNVNVYDANSKDYILISNKFLLYLIHKELYQDKE